MIRNKKLFRTVSIVLSIALLNQIIVPTVAWALTTGPSQPEMQAFTPITSTDYVDLFSGDFTYNIPLFDVEGLPINLTYHSGVTADQEASWVGLGWNINPGVINRQVRGIPDDFKGDMTTESQNVKDNITVGIKATISAEVVGWALNNDNPNTPLPDSGGISLGATLGFSYNNYRKFGIERGIQAGLSGPLSAGIDINNSSQGGLTISPSVSVKLDEDAHNTLSINGGMNSREGMQDITLSYDKRIKSDDVGSFNLNYPFSFEKPVFYPSFSLPKENLSFSYTVKPIGSAIFLLYPHCAFTGYYVSEYLKIHKLSKPSYGTLYSQRGSQDENALLDFEREKDIPFRQSSVNLAVPYSSFDIFDVSANDIGGSFHIARNDLGIYRDPYLKNSSINASAGFDIGPGNTVHVGANFNFVSSYTTTSSWNDQNQIKQKLDFLPADSSSLFESAYFKDAGEMTVNQGEIYNETGSTYPATVAIERQGTNAVALNRFSTKGAGIIPVEDTIKNLNRIPRQQVLTFLNAYDASHFGLDKTINTYRLNSLPDTNCVNQDFTPILRGTKPSHHISEITILKPDGKRYIYGIPAYNNYQKEVTFNSDENSVDTNNLVIFSGSDTTRYNSKGKDHYFDSKIIPPYAHSYLLTAILSPDYIDNGDDGVTPDDLGQAYKLDYTRVLANFRWRTPLDSSKAQFNEGMKSVAYDNKGSFVYGEKEVWYTHAIESRNYVAVFFLNKRRDALGVISEAGGIDTTHKLRAIDHIDLYSKADLIKNKAKAVPIKSVHFEYNYTLCKHVPNELNIDSGKLTLKDIYFTYGKSSKGKLNKYKFTYDDGTSFANPNYSLVHNDRWGNYTNHSGTYVDNLSTTDFPYTVQDKTLADEYAAAWSLRQIDLPSGGTMKINYESDSYAYVQQKRAAQMIKIKGFNYSSTAVYSNELYSGSAFVNNDYVFLNLPKYVHSKNEFRDLYLDSLEHLYYQFLVNVNNNGDPSYEYVKGYLNWDSYGVNQSDIALHDSTNVAWIKLKDQSEEVLGDVNPVSFAAWQYLRLNLPEKAYPGSDLSGGEPIDYVWAAISQLSNVMETIFGFNNVARVQSKGKYVDTAKSFIRLNNPTFNKFGGGSRVKKITLSDNWYNMVGGLQDSYDYGQEYTYTTNTLDGRSISSGVASYEPIIGNEENNFRQPVFYEDKIAAAPNNFYYAEEPLGESLFPAASVGYSEVKVRNLAHDDVTVTGPGYSINKFYTARDFPVKYDHTDIDPLIIKPNPIFKILGVNIKKSMNASQGFVVEVNDMHGKPKEQSVYNEEGALISSKEYHYKADNDNATEKHLSNSCQLVNPDGSISDGTIGVDFEVYQDMREQETNTTGGGLALNFDFTLAGPFPITAPTAYPSITNLQNRFRSSATTKLIKRYGILDKVTAIENGAKVSTENLLYDSETGSVLLSKVTNEFGKPIYKFTYPAHWLNPEMGMAYKNIGAAFKDVTFSSGTISIASPDSYFQPGDEIVVYKPGLATLADGYQPPILHTTKPSGSLLFLTSDGKRYTLSRPSTIKIIRSGMRNMMSIPVGTVSSLEYPESSGNDSIKFTTSTKILNADATLYSNLWRTEKKVVTRECDTLPPPTNPCIDSIANAILNGNYFSYPRAELTVRDAIDSGACASFFTTNASLPFGIESPIAGYFPYYVKSSSQYPGLPYDSTYVDIPSFFDVTAAVGNCTFHFVDTVKGPLPISPPGYTYYTLGTISSGKYPVIYKGPLSAYFHLNPTLGHIYVGYVYMQCSECEANCHTLAAGDTINPYRINTLGVWRPVKTYAYHDLRNPSLGQFVPSVQNDGSYASFNPIYKYDHTNHKWVVDSSSTAWIRADEKKLYDVKGNEIQSKDALNIPSAAIYRYNGSLPIAVTNNSTLNQSANDNFEDYTFQLSCASACTSHHWDFSDVLNPAVTISDSAAHTGNYSLRIVANSTAEEVKHIGSIGSTIENASASGYTLGDGGLVPEFSPSTGKYLFSGWVKVDTLCNCKPYWGNRVTITMQGSGTVYNVVPSGPVIDGWQKVEKLINISSSDTTIKVKLNANPNRATYFDDLRIFPTQGNMKSFVYDERTLRLMATLDENNYATFYEYDEEGNLIRVKKETERGIVTIQEGRNQLKIQ